MTLKKYLILMVIATLICWSAWMFVIININPEITNWIGFSLFYITLFLAITGTASIIGFAMRFVALKQELVFRSVIEAFRQSFLFAALVVASLFLVSKDLFSWLNLLLLVVGLSVLEFFLISYKSHNG